MVIDLEVLPVIQNVMDGLHIEALLHLGEGGCNDMQHYCQSQKCSTPCNLGRGSDDT